METQRRMRPWRLARGQRIKGCIVTIGLLAWVGCRATPEMEPVSDAETVPSVAAQDEPLAPPEAAPERQPQTAAPAPAEPDAETTPEEPTLPAWIGNPYALFPDDSGQHVYVVGYGRSIFGSGMSRRKAQKDARAKLEVALAQLVPEPSIVVRAAQTVASHKTPDGVVYVLMALSKEEALAGEKPAVETTSSSAPATGAEPAPTAEALPTSDTPQPQPTSEPKDEPKAAAEAPSVATVTAMPKPESADAATPEPMAVALQPAQTGNYFADRGHDFLDMFGLQIGGGTTLFARIRITKLAMLGAGFFRGKYFGLHGRAAGYWREKRLEGGALVLYEIQYERTDQHGNAFVNDEAALPTNSARANPKGWMPLTKSTWELADDDYHWADVGLGAGLLAVAADAHVSPFQMVDFVLGIFCIDIADDDARNRVH